MSRLNGKCIIVTGASSGIGAALAKELACRGANLGLLARRERELKTLTEELSSAFSNQRFCFQVADVGDEAQLEQAMHSLIERLGGVDVAIANSGIGESHSAFSSRHWEIARATLSVNLIGAIHTLEIAKDYLVKERRAGQLVGISSVAAVRGFPRSASYCASKAGLSTYLESVRGELAAAGIDVISIHPGYVRTPMTAHNRSMPWLMEVEGAARCIADAVEARKKRYIFPVPMRAIFAVLKHLPDWLYDFCAARFISSATKPKPIPPSEPTPP
jgi:short-subunit dehydrogenase